MFLRSGRTSFVNKFIVLILLLFEPTIQNDNTLLEANVFHIFLCLNLVLSNEKIHYLVRLFKNLFCQILVMYYYKLKSIVFYLILVCIMKALTNKLRKYKMLFHASLQYQMNELNK